MATRLDFTQYIAEQIAGIGNIKYKKMFGEYMVYINDKPIIIICDNIPYVKKLDEIADLMQEANTGFPYDGAKEHYILDVDNKDLAYKVLVKLESITSLPKSKKKKSLK